MRLKKSDYSSGFKDDYLSGTHIGKFSVSTKNVSLFLVKDDLKRAST